jgi:single-stranded DNA-binding protein
MFLVTAIGFIASKPHLQFISTTFQKVEFDVVAERSVKVKGEWVTRWERATFFAFNEEAENIASTLDKGHEVVCTGLQETDEWFDSASQTKRTKVKYKLSTWQIKYSRRAQSRDEGSQRLDPDRRPHEPIQERAQPRAPAHDHRTDYGRESDHSRYPEPHGERYSDHGDNRPYSQEPSGPLRM